MVVFLLGLVFYPGSMAQARKFPWRQSAAAETAVPACSAGPGAAGEHNEAATVSGTVADDSGAVIAGARVTLECGARRRRAVADAAGRYTLRVPPGRYRMIGMAPGFAAQQGIRNVDPGTSTADVVLSIASAAEAVTVVAQDGYVALSSTAGTKTGTPLLETPQAISVITGDELRARNTQTVADTLRYTAGVDPEPYGIDTRQDWFFIRGFASTADGLFLDGLSLPKITGADASWTASPASLQQVTVVKGPASVLYGQNEPGGLVDLVSKQPMEGDAHELHFEGGNFYRFQGTADFNGRLAGLAHWNYRVNGLARDSGTQTNFVKDDLDFISPALSWTPGERTHLVLLGHYMDYRTGSASSGTPAQGMMLAGGKIAPNVNGRIPTSYFGSEPASDEFHKVEYFSGYQLQQRLGANLVFRQNFRWLHLGLPRYVGLYGAGFGVPAGAEATCAADPSAAVCTRYSALAAINANQNNTHFAVDNQFQGNAHTGAWKHALLAGYNYQHQGSGVRAGYGAAALLPGDPDAGPLLDIFAPVYGAPVTLPSFNYSNTRGTLAQHGVYLQDQLSYKRLSVLLSGREDWALEHLRDLNIAPQPVNCPNAVSAACIDQNASKFTGRAGILYRLNDEFAPYFSVSTSFNPIFGLNTTRSADGQTLNTRPFVPDTGRQFEVGAKYQPSSLNAMVTAALFQITEDNLQTNDPTNPLNTVQSAQQRSRGVELEGQASLGHHLNGRASFTHEQVLYTKPFNGVSNVRPVTVPANLASVWLDYDPDKRIGGGAGVRFKGLNPGAPDNSFFVPGHTLLDAEVHYSLTSSLRAGFHAQNLLDKVYVSYCYGTSDCIYGLRRTLNGDLTYRFSSLLHPWRRD